MYVSRTYSVLTRACAWAWTPTCVGTVTACALSGLRICGQTASSRALDRQENGPPEIDAAHTRSHTLTRPHKNTKNTSSNALSPVPGKHPAVHVASLAVPGLDCCCAKHGRAHSMAVHSTGVCAICHGPMVDLRQLEAATQFGSSMHSSPLKMSSH